MSKIILIDRADFSQNSFATNKPNMNILPELEEGEYTNLAGTVYVTVEKNNKITIKYNANGSPVTISGIRLKKPATIVPGTYYGHCRNNKTLSSDSATIIYASSEQALFSLASKNSIRKDVINSNASFDSLYISIPSGCPTGVVELQLSLECVPYQTEWSYPEG